MIEVHHVRREHFATVVAGDLPQSPEKRECCLLALLHPIQLGLTVCRVIPDVVGTLRPRCAHQAHDRTSVLCMSNERPHGARTTIDGVLKEGDVLRAFPAIKDIGDARLRKLSTDVWRYVSERNPAWTEIERIPLHPT